MAQHFSIPFSFQFVPQHLKWHVVDFEIVGREQDFKPAPATFPGTAIPIPAIGKPVEEQRNQVVIRIDSATIIPLLSPERLYTAIGPEESAFVESLATLALKGRAIPKEMTQLLVTGGDNGRTSTRRSDAWTMRDDFFKVEESPRSLARFLNRRGHWGWPIARFHRTYTGTEVLRLVMGEKAPSFLLPQALWRTREEYRAAFLGSPASWLSAKASLGVTHQRSEFPYLGITSRACSQAIEATITLDHLRKVKSSICARPDCDNIFTVESNHGKRYCDQYCAHLESVRRNRAASKQAKMQTTQKAG